ncbi:uncharacterized protein BDR25DRAFT_354934 [Lindgomyces ingoldianus]|uniref:Uncharacterized protein n=1 Tax=Lindgomyces ingoldianus TaxID=673940 RepID=A0ACB6QWR8_9PLEO|nr:uncharacterized protein BDR25DRAFT_354934 [Lindgomyces ingoldianus]KAF2471023.1 hypothetical protein BDR25DRAFT_354934 [Lindgomyces ingoldianus]
MKTVQIMNRRLDHIHREFVPERDSYYAPEHEAEEAYTRSQLVPQDSLVNGLASIEATVLMLSNSLSRTDLLPVGSAGWSSNLVTLWGITPERLAPNISQVWTSLLTFWREEWGAIAFPKNNNLDTFIILQMLKLDIHEEGGEGEIYATNVCHTPVKSILSPSSPTTPPHSVRRHQISIIVYMTDMKSIALRARLMIRNATMWRILSGNGKDSRSSMSTLGMNMRKKVGLRQAYLALVMLLILREMRLKHRLSIWRMSEVGDRGRYSAGMVGIGLSPVAMLCPPPIKACECKPQNIISEAKAKTATEIQENHRMIHLSKPAKDLQPHTAFTYECVTVAPLRHQVSLWG